MPSSQSSQLSGSIGEMQSKSRTRSKCTSLFGTRLELLDAQASYSLMAGPQTFGCLAKEWYVPARPEVIYPQSTLYSVPTRSR